jgi:ankyrin repeat protein
MKKFILFQIIFLLCVFSIFPQVKQTLDEQISQAVTRSFPEWKPVNPAETFQFVRGSYSPDIEASWKKGTRKVYLRVMSLGNTNVNKKFDFLVHPFLTRAVVPTNRKVGNLGDSAHLVETESRVEIAFYKANVYAVLNFEFPDNREDKTLPYYYAPAPKEEVESALEFARVIVAAINGEKTFSPCFNNFYRQPFSTPATLEEEFLVAIQKGETETVKSLIGKNVNPNYVFSAGETALHLAVRQGCLETVKTLIAAKADVNAKNKKGETPLMIAANFGDLELVKYLVSEAHADVHAKDIYGRNAVFFVIGSQQGVRLGSPPASIEEKRAVIKYLAEKGVNLNEKDTLDGNTVLTALLYDCYGSPDCKSLTSLLLDLGADINAENKYGRTALIHAVDRINATQQKDFIKLLLERGADPKHKDKNSLSALGYAMKAQKLYQNDKGYLTNHIAETIRLLKDAGAIE